MALPKRGVPKSIGPQPNDLWTDPEFSSDYPSIFAFLNDVKYDDGSLRKPGGLTVYVRMGVLTFACNDNDRQLVAYVNAPTWAEALFKVEVGICEDSLDWKAKTAFVPKQSGENTQVPPF